MPTGKPEASSTAWHRPEQRRSPIQSCQSAHTLQFLDKTIEKPRCKGVQRSAFCSAPLPYNRGRQGLKPCFSTLLRGAHPAIHHHAMQLGAISRYLSLQPWIKGISNSTGHIACLRCRIRAVLPYALLHFFSPWLDCGACFWGGRCAATFSMPLWPIYLGLIFQRRITRAQTVDWPRYCRRFCAPRPCGTKHLCTIRPRQGGSSGDFLHGCPLRMGRIFGEHFFIFTHDHRISPAPYLGSCGATAHRHTAPHNRATIKGTGPQIPLFHG